MEAHQCNQHSKEIAVLQTKSDQLEKSQDAVFKKLDDINKSVSEFKTYVEGEFGKFKGAVQMAMFLSGLIGTGVGIAIDFLLSGYKFH